MADALSRKDYSWNGRSSFLRIEVTSSLIEKIKVAQLEALSKENLKEETMVKQCLLLTEESRGLNLFQGRIWVPKIGRCRELLLEEGHKSKYWWLIMKLDIASYVEKCITCLQVKPEHQRPYGSIQPLATPEWKWEHITMDFVTKLSKTLSGHETIWVIVDRLTKSAHFLEI